VWSRVVGASDSSWRHFYFVSGNCLKLQQFYAPQLHSNAK
jgi:hypothetical protein